MVKSLPFGRPGRFYRGNLHTHSTRSDGKREVADVVGLYKTQGYDFLALTDHFLERYSFPITDTRAFQSSTFTTLIGAEIHAPRTEVGEIWHMVAVGLPLDFAPTTPDETGPTLAARAVAAGAFVGIAHPAWYNLSLADAQSIEVAHAVEVYNETCAQENDRGDSWHLTDQLLVGGRRLLAYAADDAHFNTRPDYCAAWVQVKAETLTPSALLAALKAGHFYSSQGPSIHHLAIDDDRLQIACSPARAVIVSGPRAASRSIRDLAIVEAELPIDRFAGGYCRVTVIDTAGRRAWTNPIWLD